MSRTHIAVSRFNPSIRCAGPDHDWQAPSPGRSALPPALPTRIGAAAEQPLAVTAALDAGSNPTQAEPASQCPRLSRRRSTSPASTSARMQDGEICFDLDSMQSLSDALPSG